MPHAYPSKARLDHVQLLSPDPDRLAAFYCSTLDMQRQEAASSGVVCAGPERTMLFSEGRPQELGYGAFGFETAGKLEERRQKLVDGGISLRKSPSPLFDERAFAVADPDGNVVVFGIARPTQAPSSGLRARLQHLVFASPEPDRLAKFYADVVGFWPSDRVVDQNGVTRAIWLRSDEEHHSLAIFLADACAVDHHSYELEDWYGIRDWADHFAAHDIGLIWGPGRHGPGDNLFMFISDPDGNKIELSAELERVPFHRPLGTWPNDRRAFNLWGPAPLRMK